MTTVAKEGLSDNCISPLAVVEGPHPVHFSIGCVVHPFAVIVAQRGPIDFGVYCIVEEHACIINGERGGEDAATAAPPAVPMSIGPYNHFKPFSHIANVQRIGHGNRFEAHCQVGGPRGESPQATTVEDYSVVGPFVRLWDLRRDDGPNSALAVTIPSRRVYLCPTDTEEGKTCECSALALLSPTPVRSCCSCFGCWVLPRGEPFDEEETDEAMRQKSSRLRVSGAR
ncbi:uncharacterized protein Tco025E_04460 [Trypanosoma conorhini]|uniref:Dynactin subunit 6 n=1 Tax=Trypanosoma conorhini TaxID=83891 RepID=A0A422PL44_9TRYP|nr:uncharacterized protein Tco025E_04460 [Trypanosoma conorhini]RNF18440.1 hypothetical protein Tco025E_04460 [Trypanosoma conorhini]